MGHFELCSFCSDVQIILLERFQIVKKVGEGNFSTVFLAKDLWLPELSVALKVFHSQYQDIGLAVHPNKRWNLNLTSSVGV